MSFAWTDCPGVRHDPHYAGLADEVAVGVAVQHGLHESTVDSLELQARVAQPGHLDHGGVAEVQACTGGQGEQVDATGGDVLPHLPGLDREAGLGQLVVQFRVHEVDLPQVRLARVPGHPGAVFDCHTLMRVTVHPEPGHHQN